MMKSRLLLLISFFAVWSAAAQTRRVLHFPDGKIKLISHQGTSVVCGLPVGTDSLFYKSGNLKRTVHYENRFPKQKIENCRSIFTVRTCKEFHESGTIKEFWQTMNLYEGEIKPCGNWEWTTEDGKIIQERKFSKCAALSN